MAFHFTAETAKIAETKKLCVLRILLCAPGFLHTIPNFRNTLFCKEPLVFLLKRL